MKKIAERAIKLRQEAAPGDWPINIWTGTEGGWTATGPVHVGEEIDFDEPGCPAEIKADKDAAFLLHASQHYAKLAQAYLNLRRILLCGVKSAKPVKRGT